MGGKNRGKMKREDNRYRRRRKSTSWVIGMGLVSSRHREKSKHSPSAGKRAADDTGANWSNSGHVFSNNTECRLDQGQFLNFSDAWLPPIHGKTTTWYNVQHSRHSAYSKTRGRKNVEGIWVKALYREASGIEHSFKVLSQRHNSENYSRMSWARS